MAAAREHARKRLGNGFTEVQIYVDNTTIATVTFPDDVIDSAGYQDALNLRLAHHQGLLNVTEGRPAR